MDSAGESLGVGSLAAQEGQGEVDAFDLAEPSFVFGPLAAGEQVGLRRAAGQPGSRAAGQPGLGRVYPPGGSLEPGGERHSRHRTVRQWRVLPHNGDPGRYSENSLPLDRSSAAQRVPEGPYVQPLTGVNPAVIGAVAPAAGMALSAAVPPFPSSSAGSGFKSLTAHQVLMPKKISTMLSQDPEVGAKCSVIRESRSSHAVTSGGQAADHGECRGADHLGRLGGLHRLPGAPARRRGAA